MKVKLLSLFLFLISLTACSPNNQNDKAVHFGIAQKPQNLDPRFASDAASEKMNNLIYSSLFYYDSNFKMQSDIVSYQIISSTEYVFELKEDLPYFHNGSRLNIKDIIATLENVISDPMSPLAVEFKNIDKLVKISHERFSIFYSILIIISSTCTRPHLTISQCLFVRHVFLLFHPPLFIFFRPFLGVGRIHESSPPSFPYRCFVKICV